MPISITILLLACLFCVAFLYASVGHGGASGYLATLVLFGISPVVMRPSALILNVLVASMAFFQFYRAGYFRWAVFWPFALASVPMSFLGATFTLSDYRYKILLAACLVIALTRLLWQPNDIKQTRRLSVWLALGLGTGIGLLSGMLGIGGGILLSPLLLVFRWADIKSTAAVSALFILVNSLAALFGLLTKVPTLHPDFLGWVAVAAIGGWLGGRLGSERFSSGTLRYLLAVGLLLACVKLVLI